MENKSLWQNRDYILMWTGQIVSTLGSSATGVIYPLLILELTKSAALAGFAGALNSIPYIIFSLPVGALIDRWDRKKVMIVCDAVRFLVLAGVALAMYLDLLTIWQIYISALIEGSCFVFFNIAEVAALSRIVPKEHLPAAAGQNEAATGAAVIIGPSLGTMLYQSVGRMAPFVADSLSFALSAVSLFFIKAKFQTPRETVKRNLKDEIAEGLKWLWGQPLIRFMALLTGSCNMVFAATPLLMIVLAKNLGATDGQIGVIFSVAGVGGIVGSLIGGQIKKWFTFGQVITGVMFAQTLMLPLYLVAPHYLFLGVVMALTAVTGPVYNVVQFSYRISIIPDHLQGRVNSTFRLIAFGFNPLGAALSGILIEKFGVNVAIGFFTLWMLLFSTLTAANVHIRQAGKTA